MPTPPIPGWKLPVAVGTRSPILSWAFTLSTVRTWGACKILVLASLSAAWSSALGSVMEKSELARWPRLESGIAEDPAFVVVVLVPLVGLVRLLMGLVSPLELLALELFCDPVFGFVTTCNPG